MDNEELKRQAIQEICNELAEFLGWVVEAQEYVPQNRGTERVVDMVIAIQREWKKQWNLS